MLSLPVRYPLSLLISFVGLIPCANSQCLPVPAGLIGWWPGDGHANDIIGTNHATLQNGAKTVAGYVDHSFSFDGTNDEAAVAPSGALNLVNAVTVAAWVKPALAVSTSARLIGGKAGGWGLWLTSDGHAQFKVSVGGVARTVTSSGVLSTSAFTLVAGSYDSASGALNIYLNGAAESSATVASAMDDNASIAFEMGGLSTGGSYFGGLIDEVQVFGAALDPSEVSAIFAAGQNGLCKRSFRISAITANNVAGVDAGQIIGGTDNYGMAVGGNRVFLAGSGGTGSWGATDLSGAARVNDILGGAYVPRTAMVENLRDGKVYSLGQDGALCFGSTYYTVTTNQLIELDPDTGLQTNNVIPLSQPITLSGDGILKGVFPGYDRIVLVESGYPGSPVWNIDLPSGLVTNIGSITALEYHGNRPGFAMSLWGTWGVAEFFNGSVYLDYLTTPDTIVRTNVATNETTILASILPKDLANGHDFAVSPALGRWYYHYDNYLDDMALVGGYYATLGFADASFAYKPGQPPVITNMPPPMNGRTSITTTNPVITWASPKATDRDGKSLPVTCHPASGSSFPAGFSAVTCTATDVEGNVGSGVFWVLAEDLAAPVLKVPKKVKATAPKGQLGVVVNFTVSAVDRFDGVITPVANPPSGSVFPIGNTTVVVTATDRQKTAAQKSFTVSVKAAKK